jgi:hypothetical protein
VRLRPVFAGSEAGESTTGKIKKSGKIEKSVDAFLAFQLQAALHNLSAVALAKADSNSIHFIIIHEKEIHFTLSLL